MKQTAEMGRSDRSRLLAIATAALAACAEERPPLGEPVCVGWEDTVAPLVADRCASCHSAREPAGSYALDSYASAIAIAASGARRVTPGDPQSGLLTIFERDSTHAALAGTRDTLARWIVDCDARYLRTALHAPGIQDPTSPDFHGRLLRGLGFDFAACRGCHGEDDRGGASGSSCVECHPSGPAACETCHADLLERGAHRLHVEGGALARPAPCETCHLVPQDPFEPGHFRLGSGAVDPDPPEVLFSGPAVWPAPDLGSGTSTIALAARFDPVSRTCSGVYCHGGAFEDAAALHPRPSWEAPATGDCASCHGQPPSSHESEACGQCHGSVASGPGVLVDAPRHLDGQVAFGPEAAECDACHGTAASLGAPGPDLDGERLRSSRGVGAHEPHVNPRLGLAAPVRCEACHVVPDRVLAPGHIDSARPAELFGALSDRLAFADGATPTYDAETGTCSGDYCHGGGASLADDRSTARVRRLSWTGYADEQVFCGSCHGAPPDDAEHLPGQRLSDCVECHAETVDAFGRIVFDAQGRTRHMDGRVEP